ncbi:hypothetical protein L7F22_043792 [Adiantum nelumboides]|nr:hypothetical protein [Adiantum nelumboides]
MFIQLSALLFCGLLAFTNECAADNTRVFSLTTSVGNIFSSTPYPNIEDMLSEIQATDLDRVDWVDPVSLIRLRQAPDQLSELATVIDNIKFLTDMYNKLGPWTVTNKSPLIVPDGDVHQYLSWARYFWPVNSTIQNTSTSTSMQKRKLKRDTTDYNVRTSEVAAKNATSTPPDSKQAETPASSTETTSEDISNQIKTSSGSDSEQMKHVTSKDQKKKKST